MNTLTSLPAGQGSLQLTHVLQDNGLTCHVVHLSAEPEAIEQEAPLQGTRLLFVVDGEVTVMRGQIATVLRKDQALLIPEGATHALSTPNGAKLFRVDIPPRVVVTPQILTT